MKVYCITYTSWNECEHKEVLAIFSTREKALASNWMQGEHDNEIEEWVIDPPVCTNGFGDGPCKGCDCGS